MDLDSCLENLDWLESEAELEKALYSEHGAIEHKEITVAKIRNVIEFLKEHEDELDLGLLEDALESGRMALDIFSSKTLNAARMFISARKTIEEFISRSRRLLARLARKKEKKKIKTEEEKNDILSRLESLEKRVESLEKAVFGDDLRREYALLLRENIRLSAELEQIKREKERLEEKLRKLLGSRITA